MTLKKKPRTVAIAIAMSGFLSHKIEKPSSDMQQALDIVNNEENCPSWIL
ncbi:MULTISPECIES: hypothetical protein [Spirulina sp. CCY15215]|nr:hypothetical protein [Spirulina major]